MRIAKYCLLLTIIAPLAYSAGCKKEVSFTGGDEQALYEKARIRIISTEEFRGIMGKGENYKLIDCRQPDELQSGYMPGSINIPRGRLEFEITEKIPLRNAKIFIYCNSGNRSALAAATLREMKYSDVTSIAGGFDSWALKYPDKIATKPIENEVIQKSKAEPISDSGSCGG
jgi:rhodanese-related sulfurtransferase